MFFRCTNRWRLAFVVVLAGLVTLNTTLLLTSDRGRARRRGDRPPIRPPSSVVRPTRPPPPRPPPATPARRRPPPAVLILSYEGAGGGAVSQLLNLLPGVSHHHLPLAPLDDGGRHSGIEPLPPAALGAALRLLDHTLRCNISAHADQLQQDSLWLQHAFRTVFRRRCVPRNVSVAACLEQVCRAAGTVSAHVIRPFFADLRPLLARWCGRVRLLLVQRDPRAVLASRRRRQVGLPLDTEQDWLHAARALCSRMLQDVELSDELEAEQSGFHKVVLYEHLLENPTKVARLLYEFLDFNVTAEQLKSVLQQAQLVSVAAHAAAWKTEVAEPLLRAADQACGHFYDASMYAAVADNRDLRPDVPLHGGIPQPGSDVI